MTQNLTSEEIAHLRSLLRQKKKNEAEEKRDEFLYEKEQIINTMNHLSELYANTNYFKNTTCDFTQGRPVIWWKNGTNIKLGAPGFYPADPGNFKEMGLKGIHQFYDQPLEKRNALLQDVARKIRSVAMPEQLRLLRKQTKAAKKSETLAPLRKIVETKEKELKGVLKCTQE